MVVSRLLDFSTNKTAICRRSYRKAVAGGPCDTRCRQVEKSEFVCNNVHSEASSLEAPGLCDLILVYSSATFWRLFTRAKRMDAPAQ